MSGLVNKVKEALHSDKSHEVPEGTHGPHGSRVANAADPRVDSDRDHRANPAGYNTSSTTTGAYEPGHARTYEGTQATAGAYETAEGMHGPHSSRIANAADPRVDSDRDHRANPATGNNLVGSGTGGAYGSTGGVGAGNPFAGSQGTYEGTTTTTSGRTMAPGSTFGTGPGPAPNTAGPHKSDVLNKMDPRVDSDLDGSKTMGGNKTFGA